MKRIPLSVVILFAAVTPGYAGELSVADGAGILCASCDNPELPDTPGSLPVAGSRMSDLVGRAAHSPLFFPVMPQGQQQFDTHYSKLRGEGFRWHAP